MQLATFLKKNTALTSADEVRQIAEPFLQQYNLNYFRYARLYNDNYRFSLCNHADWIEHYYQQEYFNLGKCDRHPSCYQSCYLLWDGWDRNCQSYLRVGKDAEDHFNLAHGLTIIDKQAEWCDIIEFTTTRENYRINNFYLNNIDLFENFVAFFKEKAEKLINQAINDRFLVNYAADINIFEEYPDTLPYKILRQTKITRRELECLGWIAQGKTMEETAGILNISPRTIKAHITSTKEKLGCTNLFQLGMYYAQLSKQSV